MLPSRGRDARTKSLVVRAARFPFEPLESRVLLSTVYVDANAPGVTQNGASWGTAYTDLQLGLAAAASGDEIWVADGTYRPTGGTDRAVTFALKANVALKGGYAGYGAADPYARDFNLYTSTLSGDIGSIGDNSDNSYHVLSATNLASAALSGFTISGGNATNTAASKNGGGLITVGSGLTIEDCIFSGNSADLNGGAVYCYDGTVFTRVGFVSNHAHAGGGVYGSGTFNSCQFVTNSASVLGGAIFTASGTVDGCTFDRNSSESGGGAIFVSSGELTVNTSIFQGNTARYQGGAVGSVESTLLYSRCDFIRNSASSGGGIQDMGSNSLTIRECKFYGNVATGGGGGLAIERGSIERSVLVGNLASGGGGIYVAPPYLAATSITNCAFSGNQAGGTGGSIFSSNTNLKIINTASFLNTATTWPEIYQTGGSLDVSYSAIAGPPAGVGNTGASPLFLRTPSRGLDGSWGTPDDDYGDLRLGINSPCIDAGNNTALAPDVTTDLNGEPRYVDMPAVHDPGAILDMGPYEYQYPLTVVAGEFRQDNPSPSVQMVFNGDVLITTLSSSDLVIEDAATGTPLPAPAPISSSLTFNTRTAKWILPAAIPDGNYVARIQANAVTDRKNNGLSNGYAFNFFVLGGDANHDRKVDLYDLTILAINWQGTGKTFSEGDFNYDGTVNSADLGILATKWQARLDPPPAPAPPSPTSAPTRGPARTPTRVATLVL